MPDNDRIILTGPTPLQRVAAALRSADLDLESVDMYLQEPQIEAVRRVLVSLRQAVGALAEEAVVASIRKPEARRDDRP